MVLKAYLLTLELFEKKRIVLKEIYMIYMISVMPKKKKVFFMLT
jgi:hypothetical protein